MSRIYKKCYEQDLYEVFEQDLSISGICTICYNYIKYVLDLDEDNCNNLLVIFMTKTFQVFRLNKLDFLDKISNNNMILLVFYLIILFNLFIIKTIGFPIMILIIILIFSNHTQSVYSQIEYVHTL